MDKDRRIMRDGDELTIGRIGESRWWGIWSVYGAVWIARYRTRREARLALAERWEWKTLVEQG
jgi:hypothetical protein